MAPGTYRPVFHVGGDALFVAPANEFKSSNGYTIVTADAQGGLVDVHDRRPVVLSAADAALGSTPRCPPSRPNSFCVRWRWAPERLTGTRSTARSATCATRACKWRCRWQRKRSGFAPLAPARLVPLLPTMLFDGNHDIFRTLLGDLHIDFFAGSQLFKQTFIFH